MAQEGSSSILYIPYFPIFIHTTPCILFLSGPSASDLTRQVLVNNGLLCFPHDWPLGDGPPRAAPRQAYTVQVLLGISAHIYYSASCHLYPNLSSIPAKSQSQKESSSPVTWINLIANIKFTLGYHHQKYSFSVEVLYWTTIDGT